MSDSNWAYVTLLTHFDGANNATTFTEESTGKTMTAVGNAKLSTTSPSFGTASLTLDGTGDAVQLATDSGFDFGTGDFTIELFVKHNNIVDVNRDVLSKRASTANFGSFAVLSSSNALVFYASSNGSSWDIASAQTIGAVSAGVWRHVAITRNGTTFRTYLNGVQGSTWTSSAAFTINADNLSIGAAADGSGSFNGFIDEVRITKGFARYTGAGSFSPPVAAFDAFGPPAVTGAPSLEIMTAAAYTTYGASAFVTMSAIASTPPAADVYFSSMLASASAPGGEESLVAMSASGEALVGTIASADVSFEDGTADGIGLTGSTSHIGQFAQFAAMEATGQSSAGSVADGDAAMEEISAVAYGPMFVDISFEDMTALGVALAGTVASADITFEMPVMLGTSSGGSMALGTARFAYPTADADGLEVNSATADISFAQTFAQASALNGTVATGAPSFEDLAAAARSLATTIASGAASFAPLAANGLGLAVLADARTWAVNAGTGAVTEYQNYDFDGYGELSGVLYAAGPSGLFSLVGVTDNGSNIAWRFRIGMVDDKKVSLKRLEEVLLAARVDGPIRLKVWTDDDSYFEYNIPNFRPGVIQQVRAKLGKGTRSRFYRVEVYGVGNVAAEFHSMQLPMIELARRVG